MDSLVCEPRYISHAICPREERSRDRHPGRVSAAECRASRTRTISSPISNRRCDDPAGTRHEGICADRAALDNVSLHVAKGEFVFLTGPSGSGKSTMLKLIFMEERPTLGEVRVSGVNSATLKRGDVAQLRRKLGVVFQDFRLLDDRTAHANVAFALEVTGAAEPSVPAKVSRLLTQVGLASKGLAFPKELSGGEQQRVAIARALVNDPFVLIADEPTGQPRRPGDARHLPVAARDQRARAPPW